MTLFNDPFADVTGAQDINSMVFRFNTTAPFLDERLIFMFGTIKPEMDQIQAVVLAGGDGDDFDEDLIGRRDLFWNQMGRGPSRYLIANRNGKPDQVLLAGVSYD